VIDDPGLAVVFAVLLAGVLEATLGEPPGRYHPVAFLGRVIERLETRRFGIPRLAGIVYAVSVPLSSSLVVYGVVWVGASAHPIAAAALSGVVLWLVSSLRMLLQSAREVIDSSGENPEGAREALLALVGRETADLSPGLIRSAALESLAENLSDGLVAPLSAFVALSFVSVPAAAAGAAFVKAVNTMDSMLGYPGPFGWGSARLDDLVMFVPARISAALLGLAAGDPDAAFRARRYVHKPASPNAGWPMGTLAAALNVRLEKPGVYVLNDVAAEPTLRDGAKAITATRRAGIAAYALAALAGVLRWL
jgi:adenosylcobinamide-phosphate synthase